MFGIEFCTKKSASACVYFPYSRARALERLIWLKYNIALAKGKIHSLQGWMLPKIHVTSEKASNKSCSELNFVPKSLRAHMSISPQSGARGLERLILLKYNTVMKRENTFNCQKYASHPKKRQIKVIWN